MLTDNFQDIGDNPYPNIVCRSGATFPQNPLVGYLFIHDTHGLCVRCHDGVWRKVQR